LSQTPIIIPLIVAGMLLGSLWQNKTLTGVWKKTLLFAAIAGLLNSVNAFLVGYLRISGADSSNGQVANIVSSGLAGFLIVLAVFVSAAGVIRHRRGEELEQQQQ
jgi:hypothetical protein